MTTPTCESGGGRSQSALRRYLLRVARSDRPTPRRRARPRGLESACSTPILRVAGAWVSYLFLGGSSDAQWCGPKSLREQLFRRSWPSGDSVSNRIVAVARGARSGGRSRRRSPARPAAKRGARSWRPPSAIKERWQWPRINADRLRYRVGRRDRRLRLVLGALRPTATALRLVRERALKFSDPRAQLIAFGPQFFDFGFQCDVLALEPVELFGVSL